MTKLDQATDKALELEVGRRLGILSEAADTLEVLEAVKYFMSLADAVGKKSVKKSVMHRITEGLSLAIEEHAIEDFEEEEDDKE